MGMALIECTSIFLDVAKAAVVNAGGQVHGVFQDIAHDSFWLKVEVASCADVVEVGRIPIFEASVEEVGGKPVLRIGLEKNWESSFRLVEEVK